MRLDYSITKYFHLCKEDGLTKYNYVYSDIVIWNKDVLQYINDNYRSIISQINIRYKISMEEASFLWNLLIGKGWMGSYGDEYI